MTDTSERVNVYSLTKPFVTTSHVQSRLPLRSTQVRFEGLGVDDDGAIHFAIDGWFEVLLTVAWDPGIDTGHRFAHTAIPDSHPLHSEAIEARVLCALSEGRQLLRGSTRFDPRSPVRSIALEVWQDSGQPVAVDDATLAVRQLTGVIPG